MNFHIYLKCPRCFVFDYSRYISLLVYTVIQSICSLHLQPEFRLGEGGACVELRGEREESILSLFVFQVVLASILPYYLEYVKNENSGASEKKKECRDELTALSSLHCSVQVLLKSCNSLRRQYLHKLFPLFSACYYKAIEYINQNNKFCL